MVTSFFNGAFFSGEFFNTPIPPDDELARGGWPPVKVGYKKGRRQAKRLIDDIKEAFASLDEAANPVAKAEVIQKEIIQAVPIVDKYPELLQQLMHIKQQLDAYMRSIDEDDDEFFLLM